MKEKNLVTVSRLFYESQLSKTQIGERLHISITHVNRLLKEAIRRGVVQIKVKAPHFEDLELELKEKFALLDARVVAVPDQEKYLRAELGKAGASYFEENFKKGQKVGIGSGRTVLEMVSSISERARNLSLYPIAVFAKRSLDVRGIDANTAVNIVWFKSRPKATASRFEMFFPQENLGSVERNVKRLLGKPISEKFLQDISDLDCYFFSCGALRSDTQLYEIIQSNGTRIESMKKSGVIGDFLFNTINSKGEYVRNSIEKSCLKLSIPMLKKTASNNRKKIVLIAGGKSKFTVIKAGLKGKLFNTLITDSQTAESLLRIKEP